MINNFAKMSLIPQLIQAPGDQSFDVLNISKKIQYKISVLCYMIKMFWHKAVVAGSNPCE